MPGEAEEIGRRARHARLRLGMTQADLAAALGRTQGWVSKMERGRIELAELETAERLAPQLIRHHPIARSTLRSLVHAERVPARERLRRMSDRFHLDG